MNSFGRGLRGCVLYRLHQAVAVPPVRASVERSQEILGQCESLRLVDVLVADVPGLGRFDAVLTARMAGTDLGDFDTLSQGLVPRVEQLPGDPEASRVILVAVRRDIASCLRVGACVEPVGGNDEHRADANHMFNRPHALGR